jgi:hypothetical protein
MNTKSILIAAASFIATALLAADPPAIGSAAPDFSLTDAKGKSHLLSQYKGKYVVLEWFNPEFFRARDGRVFDPRASGENYQFLEDSSYCASPRSGRQGWARLWGEEHAEHGGD